MEQDKTVCEHSPVLTGVSYVVYAPDRAYAPCEKCNMPLVVGWRPASEVRVEYCRQLLRNGSLCVLPKAHRSAHRDGEGEEEVAVADVDAADLQQEVTQMRQQLAVLTALVQKHFAQD